MKFKINNREWVIQELSQREIKEIQNKRNGNKEDNLESVNPRYYGVTFCDELKIILDKDLPIDRKRATLIHELTHCYIDNYITHSDKEYIEEDVADIVSNSYDIIHEIMDRYFNRTVGVIKDEYKSKHK